MSTEKKPMKIKEIVDSKIQFSKVPMENSMVVLDSVLLTEAIKPIAKWQRSSGFDEPMLNAVMIEPLGSKSVRLISFDLATRLVTDLAASHVKMERPVAVDIRSLVSLLALSVAEVAIVFEGQSAAISIPGGWAYLPTHAVDPLTFEKDLVEPGKSEGRRVMADALWATLNSLKKLASTAPAGELRLLFGSPEKVYACDGNVVAASSCYFLPTAVTVADVEVICALLSTADPAEKVVLAEVGADKFAVVTERFSFEFQRKGVKLSKKVLEKADGRAATYFFVDSEILLRAVKAISSVKDASGKVRLAVKRDGKNFVMEAAFEDTAGNITRMDVARESIGVTEPISIETSAEYLRTILELSASEALAKLELSEKGISAESENVFALVISGNVG